MKVTRRIEFNREELAAMTEQAMCERALEILGAPKLGERYETCLSTWGGASSVEVVQVKTLAPEPMQVPEPMLAPEPMQEPEPHTPAEPF